MEEYEVNKELSFKKTTNELNQSINEHELWEGEFLMKSLVPLHCQMNTIPSLYLPVRIMDMNKCALGF